MKFPSFINVLPGDALTTLQLIECKPCRHILLKYIHVSEAPTKIFGISKCGKMKEELIKTGGNQIQNLRVASKVKKVGCDMYLYTVLATLCSAILMSI